MVVDLSTQIPSIKSPNSAISASDFATLQKTAPNITNSQWNDINLALSNGALSPAGRTNALKAIAAKGGLSTNNKTISGSASVGMNNNIKTATNAAATGSGLVTGTSVTDASKTPPATDGTQKPSVSVPPAATTTDPILSTLNTQLQSLTTQYNGAVSTENDNFQQQVNDANSVFAPQFSQVQQDKAKAIAAASAAYDKGSPGSTDSQKQEYIASVGSAYENTISEMSAQHTANMDNLYQTHTSNLQNLSSSYSTSQANITSSIAAQYQQNFTNLNTEMNTNPPNTSKIGSEIATEMANGMSLSDAINSSTTLQPYLQLAMSSGQFPTEQAALEYILNPTLGEKKLSVSQQSADAATARVGIAAGTLDLQRQVDTGASTQTTGFDNWLNSNFGTTLGKITQKSLGGNSSSGSNTNSSVSNGIDLSQFNN